MELYIQVKRLDMNEQKLKVAISEFVNRSQMQHITKKIGLNAKNVKSITSRLPRTGFWL